MVEDANKSEFNDAYSHFRRINFHLNLANIAHTDFDFWNWFQNLNIVLFEIQPLIDNLKDREEMKTLKQRIKGLINKELCKIQTGSSNSYSSDLIDTLELFEEKLRDYHKNTGLLYREKFDPLKLESKR
jgi:surface polysaccharide O-acyltransferase-like enzyme